MTVAFTEQFLLWPGNGPTSILPRQIHRRECRLEVQLIGSALTYLRDKVNNHLQDGETDSGQPLVVFIEGDKIDPLNIQSGRVNILVVNVEEERELRGRIHTMTNAVNGSIRTYLLQYLHSSLPASTIIPHPGTI